MTFRRSSGSIGPMHRSAIAGALAALLSVAGAVAAPKPPAPAQRLAAPEHLDPKARQEIKARMGQHATTMQNLVRTVVLLDRPTIRVMAARIADEEVVARTGAKGDKQAPALPAKFFAEQDALATAARQLAAAAVDGGDDKTLAERFAALTRTCVGCHSTYLHDRPEAPAADPRAKSPVVSPPVPPGAH